MATIIRTPKELAEYMSSVNPNYQINDDKLIWFVCVQEARFIFDGCTIKDLARSLKEGIAPINSIEQVQNWLDTFYSEFEDDDHVQISQADQQIKEIVRDFLGVNEQNG
ncbi:MAG: hypothetical protein ACXW0J_03155 [Nitrososphaeraceae archaeon]